jgi:predicted CXXCH cytochrome family protein
MASPHSVIQCENCHGPGIGHPEKVKKLPPGDSRQLCWRCHSYLPYHGSGRAVLPGFDLSAPHLPLGMECYDCHTPHYPGSSPDSLDDED